MSLQIIFALLALSGAAGIILGYVLRWLVALGQRGSLELEIKQRMLAAQEKASKIIADAEYRGEVLETERLVSIEEREEKAGKLEERLIKKEELLDARQQDQDARDESLRARESEAARSKQEADALVAERVKILERTTHLSADKARDELFRELERRHEEAILLRLQKLDANGRARLEDKARAILTHSPLRQRG
jgi:ribonucrease Y